MYIIFSSILFLGTSGKIVASKHDRALLEARLCSYVVQSPNGGARSCSHAEEFLCLPITTVLPLKILICELK